ncbi:hypothetical protein [Priestia megaterium]|uniref:hypothetical protein n=1 Tax=Priestia megaterium TaxID=1404 RepID=UPI000BF597B4|nr:hypothetical protein [Priestia megaterium]PFR90688.1 hypothetical protein COK39_24650 [Priestia megaterium]
MKKFALLVGNGFTLDFIQPKGLHSSFPLKNFNNINISYNPDFMENIPDIKSKLLGSDLNDFDAIKNYVELFKEDEEEYFKRTSDFDYIDTEDPKYKRASNLHVQLRRFIAMAYSVLQNKIDEHDMSDWKWIKWLDEHKAKLAFAISLNYDVVLENSLLLAKANFYRVGTDEFYRPIPLIKPHGSIDFDLPSDMIDADNPWSVEATLNDGQYVRTLPKSEWLNPRIEADIIVPSLHNIQRHLSWVRKMFDQYSEVAQQLDSLVIVGCSYWDVDRAEIDFFLERLNRRTKVYIVDPFPNKDLVKKIQGLGLSYKKLNKNGFPW